jgi:hypothetical protein
MTQHELKFQLQNETKGALRYAEVLPGNRLAQAPNDEGAVIGTLYMRKSAFPNGQYPKTLQILITGA